MKEHILGSGEVTIHATGNFGRAFAAQMRLGYAVVAQSVVCLARECAHVVGKGRVARAARIRVVVPLSCWDGALKVGCMCTG